MRSISNILLRMFRKGILIVANNWIVSGKENALRACDYSGTSTDSNLMYKTISLYQKDQIEQSILFYVKLPSVYHNRFGINSEGGR